MLPRGTSGWILAGLVGTCASAAPALARDVPVADPTELAAAVLSARPGDVILLADGTYAFDRGGWALDCAAAGEPAAPILVRAVHPLRARVELGNAATGTVVEGFHVSGPHWRVEDLDIHGTCADDSTCEHAFHVVGGAAGFVLRGNRVVDFNAQLKVNADADHRLPDGGLVEGNEVYDTRARQTGNPVTKLNIDNASGWVVRGNFIHDFHKAGGVSYGAFHKGGSQGPVFERNLVVCALQDQGGDTRIGLSFGGGGMAAGMCPPWDGSDCNPETVGGVMRNNVIVNCSDVGIYLNEAQDTRLLHNTLIETAGVDFRFSTSTGEAHGNVLSSVIRVRDGGSFGGDDNLTDVSADDFAAWYLDPLAGDLRLRGDVSALVDRGGETAGVSDDYCGRARVDGRFDWGALEHSLGDCVDAGDGGDGADGESVEDGGDGWDGGDEEDFGADGLDAGVDGSDPPELPDGPDHPSLDGDCGCAGGSTGSLALLALFPALLRRRA